MTTFRPIVAIGMSMVHDSAKDGPNHLLETTLSDYVDGKISFDSACSVFLNHTGSSKPVLRVHEILSVDDRPLPAANELFFASGADPRMVNPRKKARPWTEQEDTRLLAGIHRFGLDSWGSVTEFVGSGRSRAQCSQRWFRGLDPRISKVLWTEEEERKLIQLVQEYGYHSWTKVACALGNRSDAQCRYHYYQICGSDDGEHGHSRVPHVMSVPASGLPMRNATSGVRGVNSMRLVNPRTILPPILELMTDDDFARCAGLVDNAQDSV